MTNPGGRFLGVLLAAALLTPLLIVAAGSRADAQTGDPVVTVDSVGDVGMHPSLVLNAAGNPVVSYYDATNENLKILTCGNNRCTSGNIITTISTATDRGQYSSLALTAAGLPVVTYYNDSSNALGLLRCFNPTCTSRNDLTFTFSSIDEGWDTSLALNSSDHPVISYYDATNNDLQLLVCSNVNCPSPTPISADTAGLVGRYSSLILDGSDRPAVSYYDGTNFDLKVMRCDDAPCSTFTTTNPDSVGDVGPETSIGLDHLGNPVVSYWDIANFDLKVIHCGNTNCTAANSITSPDTAGLVGLSSSLIVDSFGLPAVAYFDVMNGDLKVLRCGDPNCTSGNSIEVPDTAEVVGAHPSLAINPYNDPVIAYYDQTNGDLKVVSCNDDLCEPSPCNGMAPTIIMDANGGDGSGTAGADIISGTLGDDVINGLGGNDLVCGNGGDDIIRGGSGDDNLRGQGGNDIIRGGGGNDILNGDQGDDELVGGAGRDFVVGEHGDDIIDGQGARDQLFGGPGADTINGQNGGDSIDGGGGDDFVGGQTGPDILRGGSDDDTMLGGNGADTLYGDHGFDRCSGNTGPDSAEAATCEQTPGVETLF